MAAALTNTGGRYDPLTDSWVATSTGVNVPTARQFHTAVWAGREMIIWGGFVAGYVNNGGRYNPVTNSWTATSTGANVPSVRGYHSAVWTSKEMIVWSGFDGAARLLTGGRYDPVANSWVPTTLTNGPAGRIYHNAVWTGREMIVFGGSTVTGALLNSGGRYDPTADSWTPTSTATGVPAARISHVAVWTGQEMIIWGGRIGPSALTNSGGRYDPATDSWAATTLTLAPGAVRDLASVWTGREMIIWGGYNGGYYNTGSRYLPPPLADSWTPTPTSAAPTVRSAHTATWTGREMIVWGGYDGSYVNSGARYDPILDLWTATSTGANVPSGRRWHTALWSGRAMIVWGGYDGASYLNSGGRYDPAADAWTTTTTGAGVPTLRGQHSAVWTGREMIVWGGYDGTSYLGDGSRYEPIGDAWTAMTGTNAPPIRGAHTAVWTGREMIVWGGYDGASYLGDGSRYEPGGYVSPVVAESWTTITPTGAPPGRSAHTAVWTGREMIVWGGYDGTSYLNSGGRYDPGGYVNPVIGESWSATDTTTAPGLRSQHTAVWTGTEMIVWGGFNGTSNLNSGGRYYPYGATSNTWTATNAVAAQVPAARSSHTAVWAEREMIVWGGLPGPLDSGSRYAACKTPLGQADHFDVIGFPGTRVAGTATSVNVQVKDCANALVAYTGTVHFSSSDVQAGLPANYTFLASEGGVHSFGLPGVTLKTAGTQWFLINDTVTPRIKILRSGIVVSTAGVNNLLVAGIGSPTVAGTQKSVTVTARDLYSNTVASYTGTVHFSSTDVGATLPGDYTFVPGDAGVHVFTNGVTLITSGSQSVTATDTVTGSITGTQTPISVTPAAAVSLSVTAVPPSVTAGVAQGVTVTARDPYGNVDTNYFGMVTFTSSDALAVLPIDYMFIMADGGIHTFAGGVTLETAGTQSVTTTDLGNASIFGSETGIVVNPAGAATLVVSGIGSPIPSCTPASVTVTARDAFGNTATGYTGTVHFTSVDIAAGLPANYTFVVGDGGVHTFAAGVTLITLGTQSVTATDTLTGSITGTQGTISVTSAIPASLSVTGIAASTTAGVSNSVTVTAKDSCGNIATGYTGTVQFTSDDPYPATLPGNYTFTGGDAGTHFFASAVTLKTSGTRSVMATDTLIAGITGSQTNILVNLDPVLTLSVAGVGSPRTAGVASNLTVTVHDTFGNIATTYTGTVHFTSTDAQAVLPANYTFVGGDAGVRVFTSGVTLKTAGTRSVIATDTLLAGITGSQTSIIVNPAAVFSLSLTGISSPRTAGVASSVLVKALDSFGNAVTGYTGTVQFTSDDPFPATLPGNYTFIDADAGIHTFVSGVTLKTAGLRTVTVKDVGTPSLTDALVGIQVNPDLAVTLALGGIANPTVAGNPHTVTLTALDAFNNTATAYLGTVRFTSSDGLAVLPPDFTFAGGDLGVHVFTGGVVLETSGTEWVKVTDTGNALITVSVLGIQVDPAAAVSVSVTGITTPTTAGVARTVTVTARDTFGNVAAGYLGTIHFTSSDPYPPILPGNYTFIAGDNGARTFTNSVTLKTSGTQSVTATDTVTASITGLQPNITVDPAARNHVNIAGTASPQVGGPVPYALQVVDIFDNVTPTVTTLTVNIGAPVNSGSIVDTTLGGGATGGTLTTGTTDTQGAGQVRVQDALATETMNLCVGSVSFVGQSCLLLTFIPRGPDHLILTPAVSSLMVGNPVTVTVQLVDLFDNNVAQAVAATLAVSGSARFVASGTNATSINTAAGTGLTSTQVTSTVAGAVSVSVTSTDKGAGVPLAGVSLAAPILFTPGPAHHAVFTIPSTNAAGTVLTLAVQSVDQYGNATTGAADVCLTITRASGGVPLVTTGTLVTPNTVGATICGKTQVADGTATLSITETLTGTLNVGSTSWVGAVSPVAQNVTVAVGPAAADHLVLTAADGTAPTCGTEHIAMQLVDLYGNSVPSAKFVMLAVSATLPALHPYITQTSLAAGINVVSTSGTLSAAGAGDATVTLDGVDTLSLRWDLPAVPGSPSGTKTVTFVLGPPDPAKSLVVSAPPSGGQIDAWSGIATLTVTPKDACGSTLGAGYDVDLSASFGILSDETPPGDGINRAVDNGNGTYSATFRTDGGDCPSAPATINVTVIDPATALPVALQSVVTLTSTCEPVSPSSVVTPATAALEACAAGVLHADGVSREPGVSTIVSVTPVDINGKPLGPHQAVHINADGVLLVEQGVTVRTDAVTLATTYDIAVGSNRCVKAPGTREVIVSVNAVEMTTRPQVSFACPPIAPSLTTFVARPAVVPADWVSKAQVAVSARDVCGNPAFGRPLTLRIVDLGAYARVEPTTTLDTADRVGQPDDATAVFEVRCDRAGTTAVEASVTGALATSAPTLLTFAMEENVVVESPNRGCGCSAHGGSATAAATWLLGLLALAGAGAWRRRRS